MLLIDGTRGQIAQLPEPKFDRFIIVFFIFLKVCYFTLKSYPEMTSAQSADAQARLNVHLREIVTFFETSGIQQHSIDLLNSFIDKHLTMDFLNLAEGYGGCMAFIDHDELVAKLFKTYTQLIDGYIIERKILNKRIRLLKEDKKTDPEVLARQENLLIDVDNKKAVAMMSMARLRAMNSISFAKFKDPKFNAFGEYKKAVIQQRANKTIKK